MKQVYQEKNNVCSFFNSKPFEFKTNSSKQNSSELQQFIFKNTNNFLSKAKHNNTSFFMKDFLNPSKWFLKSQKKLWALSIG